MERKNEHFFDGEEVNMGKVISMLQQYPAQWEQILNFVMHRLVHLTEFRVKKEHLKHKYEKKKQELYAEYMKDEE